MPKVAIENIDGMAETIIFHEHCTSFIIEQKVDRGVKSFRHRREGLWIADWDGYGGHQVNAMSREEVIEKMKDKIRRVIAIRNIECMMEERRKARLQQEARDMARDVPGSLSKSASLSRDPNRRV